MNSIDKVTKYLPAFEESLGKGGQTADLVGGKLDFTGANKVKVLKVDVGNAASYNRAAGYSKSDVTATWQEFNMTQDRYIKEGIDVMDNEETIDQTNQAVLVEISKKARKEIDMYRLGKIATVNNITTATPAALSNGSAVLNAIDKAEADLLDADADYSGSILYIAPKIYTMLKRELGEKSGRFSFGDNGVDREVEYFDGMKVVKVPQDRMMVGTQYNETTHAIEALVTNNTTQKINFLIVNPEAVAAPVKLYDSKFIPESLNANAREDVIVLNWYHDCFVFDTLAPSIYLHADVAA